MANVFLNGTDEMERDLETAILLENTNRLDIGNAVAYTDGNKVFLNTEDNLYKILPAYNSKMLKWLLWHERYHKELRHHNRFFKYLSELASAECEEEFRVSKEEVNIIMDILVHDSLSRMFPELIPTAVENLAQMRNRNSLKYTFKTFTLEEMLDEYKTHKAGDKDKSGAKDSDSKDKDGKPEGEKDGMGTTKETKDDDKMRKDESKTGRKSAKKGHKAGDSTEQPKKSDDAPEDGAPEVTDTPRTKDEHDETDWDKLKEIDSKEFITEDEAESYIDTINRLKRKTLKLARLTETLNSLVTSTRRRTYAKPNPIKVGGGVILKGSTPGYAKLYLCFDASGSMRSELEIFKDIIGKSIPQALETPCEWFTNKYGKGKFKDILDVHAWSGFDDDGDRVIELCWKAEQAGYSPIGVTDGGGRISWSKDKLVQLKKTILVGQNSCWLEKVKQINPKIQTLSI